MNGVVSMFSTKIESCYSHQRQTRTQLHLYTELHLRAPSAKILVHAQRIDDMKTTNGIEKKATPATAYLDRIPDAESAIRRTSDRLTQPRVAVLACLMSLDHAASHFDVAQALSKHHPIDRVTVYRVLEWLVDVGIAHRIAGDDRVWRFMINDPSASVVAHHQHAHFACTNCGQTFCLDDVPTKLNFKLPTGFKPQEVDLKFRGLCLHCG
jgi:Fur family transcriptional regulator, ferric uptake regulator